MIPVEVKETIESMKAKARSERERRLGVSEFIGSNPSPEERQARRDRALDGLLPSQRDINFRLGYLAGAGYITPAEAQECARLLTEYGTVAEYLLGLKQLDAWKVRNPCVIVHGRRWTAPPRLTPLDHSATEKSEVPA